ncbi:MAG: efflux RND transporter periplasmic adaptor subunit [Chloroflexota bacterium]
MRTHVKKTFNSLILTVLLLALFLLSACSSIFGNSAAEEAPVELVAYESSASNRLTTADSLDDEATESQSAMTAESTLERQVASTDPASALAAVDSSLAQQDAPGVGSDNDTISLLLRNDYNGEVVAQSTVSVVGEVNGMAHEVTVEVGDHVTAGDVLIRVDSAMLEAQRAQSLAMLEGTRAQLDQLLLEVDPEDLEAANAAVTAAVAGYNDAVSGADAEDLAIAEAQRMQAEAAVRQAQSAYNDVKWNPKIAMLPQSLQLEQATLQLEAAQAQYQKIVNGAGNNVITGAYAQLAQARAQLTNLEEGAKPEQIRAMEAQVKQAEISLYMAQLQLDKATVRAPITGVVAQLDIHVGDMVRPGVPLIVIISDDVEITINVDELSLPNLSIGQNAMIRANAYPDNLFMGEVIRTAPQLDPQNRTMQVTIRPTEAADELLPGMFVTVDLADIRLAE